MDEHKQQKALENNYEETTEEIQDLKVQLDECQNKYKRALADYQNLEKRVKDERADLIRAANRELLLRFLPILDTLLMAQQHAKNDAIGVCIQQFLDTFKQEGVTRIPTVGEQFDPYLMEVVTTTEGKEGVVMQETRAGYLLHDRLLRPAQVVVGSGEKAKKEEK